MKELPPPAPPCTGGETDARMRFNVVMQRILPLCKGELEGVVGKIKTKNVGSDGWNLKSKIIKSKIN